MLKVCKNLEEIALSNCEIKDQGARDLFENLRQHMSVKKVFLDGNMLTDKCLDSLFKLLDENPNLECASVKGLQVGIRYRAKVKEYGDRIVI